MNERDDLTAEERELLREQDVSLEALRTRHADCPRLDVLLASQSGVLPDETSEMVSAHLKECSFCQILLQDLAGEEFTSATAGEARRIREHILAEGKTEEKRSKESGGLLAIWLWRAIPVTAVLGAAAVVFLWTRPHQSATQVPPPAATVQPSQPTTASLQWEKLPIRLQADSILVWRGKPRTAQERYASELTPALTYYRDDHFLEAVERLTKVVKDFPQGVEGQVYLGVSLLKIDRNAEAIAPLRAAQNLGTEQFRDSASWYLALAYQRTQDRVGAIAELRKLCQGKSEHASRACAAAKELATP